MEIMPDSIRVFPEEKGIKSHKIAPRESDTKKNHQKLCIIILTDQTKNGLKMIHFLDRFNVFHVLVNISRF